MKMWKMFPSLGMMHNILPVLQFENVKMGSIFSLGHAEFNFGPFYPFVWDCATCTMYVL